MDLKNVVVAFFIVIVVLTLVSVIPSKNQTGHFIMPSMISLEVAIIIIIFSVFTITVILSKKSYYPF